MVMGVQEYYKIKDRFPCYIENIKKLKNLQYVFMLEQTCEDGLRKMSE